MRAVAPHDAVITGTGVATALGFGTQTVFDALAAGTSGIRSMGDAEAGSSRDLAAPIEAPFLRSPVPREMEPQIKFLNGSGELAVEAAIEAIAAARLEDAGIDPSMRSLYLSQMDSGDWSCHDFRPAIKEATDSFAKDLEEEAMNRASARYIKPFFMLESLKNNAFSFLATMFALRGANTSVAGFAGPTHQALSMGARSVSRGSADASLVVAAARLSTGSARVEMADIGMTGAPDRNVPGDGAAALVIERAETAAKRGAKPLAAVLGQGAFTSPVKGEIWSGAGAGARAVDQALREAGARPQDLLGVVAPPRTGAEPPEVHGAPTVTWRPLTGHLALAEAGVGAAIAAHAVATGRLPGAGEPGPGTGVLLVTDGLLGQAGALVLGPV